MKKKRNQSSESYFHKLYKKVRSTFWVALIILNLAILILVGIFSCSRLKRERITKFKEKHYKIESKIILILNSKITASKLISNRTELYQILESYNNGKINLKEFQALSISKLKDSFIADTSIVAFKRYDIRNSPVLSIGNIFPQIDYKVFKTSKARFLNILSKKGRFYLPVVSPIFNRKNERIGTDTIVYNLERIKRLILNYSKWHNGKTDLLIKDGNNFKSLFKPFQDIILNKTNFKIGEERIIKKKGKTYICYVTSINIKKLYLLSISELNTLFGSLLPELFAILISVLFSLSLFDVIVYIFILIRQKKFLNEIRNYIEEKEEEKELLNTYLDLSPEIFIVLDKNGDIVYINKKGIKILEEEKEEDIIGKNWFDNFLPEDVREKTRNVFLKLKAKDFEEVRTNDNYIITRKGNKKTIRWYNSIIKDKNGEIKYIISVGADITDKIERVKQIKKMQFAIEQAPVSIVITDPEGYIEYVNPFFSNFTGYSFEESIGKNPRILKSGKHDEAFYKKLWDTITSGEIWNGEFYNKKKNGDFYWEKAIIGPVFDEKGRIINYIAVKEDITELKKMMEHFYSMQKLESLGTLAGGIAHDMNNILYGISGYVNLLYRKTEANDSLKKYFDSINEGLTRASNLIKQILTFSKHNPYQKSKEIVDLSESIEKSIKFAREIIPSSIIIAYNFKARNKYVFASETSLYQVMVNLFINSRDSIGKGKGSIIVEVEDIEPDIIQQYKIKNPGNRTYVKISVTDNGKGIPEEIKDRIFEPFFTTKGREKGTGLGLSTVYRIITNLDGFIEVKSEVGKGTTFEIILPATPDIEESRETKKTVGYEDLKGSETILFVDDEKAIVESIGESLKDFGYKVIGVDNSYVALNIFKSNPKKFDIIITDQTMPGLLGTELGREILKIRKNIPMILCTGYTDTVDYEKAKDLGFKEFVIKPITSEKLALLIRKVLNKKS